MFFYFARLYQKYLQPIYPIVVFSFDQPFRAECNQHVVTFPNRQVLDFSFEAIQLNRLNWRDFLHQANPVAAALMAKMRIEPEDRPMVKAECLRVLVTLRLDAARTRLISGFIDTYLRLNPREETIFQAELARIEPSKRAGIMQIVTSWMQEGIEQGIEQGIERGIEQGIERGIEQGIERGIEQGIERGIEQGIEQGERSLILRLLARRVGVLPERLLPEIEGLSRMQLEQLGEALLDFTVLADLEQWLAENT